MGPKKDHRYEVNDKILCKHGLFFYEAKIIEIEEEDGEMVYTVHYQGWHKRYDEKIRQVHCSEMFLPLTDANIAKAKADIQEASSTRIKRKKQKLEDDEARKSETGSRGSTPSDRAGSSSHAPSTHSDRRSTTSKLSEAVVKKGSEEANEKKSADSQLGPEIDAQLELLSNLPSSITKILVDDYDAVVNQGKLAVLPARVTVYDIVQKYIRFSQQQYGKANAIDIEMHGITRVGVDSMRITAEGLLDYFDIVLGYQLLYKFEKPQYNALTKSEEENYEKELKVAQDSSSGRTRKPLRDIKPTLPQSAFSQLSDGGPLRSAILRPSKFYGLPHLLRMFVKLPALFRMTSWDEVEILMRIACIHDFIAFLKQNAPFILNMEQDYKVAGAEYSKTFC